MSASAAIEETIPWKNAYPRKRSKVTDDTSTLSVDNVKKRFGGIVAVDGLNLEVEPGEIVGLIGPNGAGKTTTLNLITGFLTPNEGRISLNGTEVTGDSPDSISKSGIGRTFQISKPFGRLSVYENLLVPNVSCGPTEQRGPDRPATPRATP